MYTSNADSCELMILVECYFGNRHSLCKNRVSFCDTTLLKTSDLKISLFFYFQLSEWDEENVILTGSMDGVVRVRIRLNMGE